MASPPSARITPSSPPDAVVAWAFARLDPLAFALASAVVAGAMIFALTLVLVVKGAPPGTAVGPHLAHLAAYFPGYTVTIGGASLGAGYAAIAGAVAGFLFSLLWNLSHALLLGVIRIGATLSAYRID